MELKQWVMDICQRLQNCGYQAYAVGGCVRDSLLGREPNDYDITTDALPETVAGLFDHTYTVGYYGTVCVVTPEGIAEVTTFRSEGAYDDFRHPVEVSYGVSLKEDVSRRDFTVNALCFDGQRILDFHDGQADLKRGVIRAIGDPTRRFEEDALRIVRAFRFASQLDFTIEQQTKQSALQCAPLLQNISMERLAAETEKLICGQNPQKGREVFDFEVLKLPIQTLDITAVPPEPAERFSALFYRSDIGVREATAYLKKLKRSNRLINQVNDILLAANSLQDAGHLLKEYGDSATLSALRLNGRSEVLADVERILKNEECYRRDMLAMNGRDLLALGFSKDKLAEILEQMLEYVLANPTKNTKDDLTEYCKGAFYEEIF